LRLAVLRQSFDISRHAGYRVGGTLCCLQTTMALALPAITISAALAGMHALGYAPAPLLAAAGLQREQLDEPFGVVPDAAFGRLWAAVLTRDPDPTLPVRVGLATPFGAFGLLDHLAGSTHSVGEALHTLAVFFRLVSATVSLDLTHHAGDQVWLVNSPVAATDTVSDQWTLGLMLGRTRALATGFVVQRVCLICPSTPADERYRALFDSEVVFGQKRSGLTLAPGTWRAPLSSANPSLHATLRALAAQVDVRAFTDDPLGYALRLQLDDALNSGQFSAADVAAQLQIPLRTLQRRLAEEQVSFQQLLDAHRQERAQALLREGDHSVSAIAYQLGYSEQSAFNRAFKRWTGNSPRAWLAAQRLPGDG
jgi:AraC-like DNA-binding protein